MKIQQIFQKLYRCLFYVVFHNSEPKIAGCVDVEKDLELKKERSKGFFVRENLKNKHCYENVIGSEIILMHKAEHPSNYFFQHFYT